MMPPRPDRRAPKPWGLLALLAVAVFAGIAAVPLQVITLSRVGTASKVDVEQAQNVSEQNRRLIRQLQELSEAQAADQEMHRVRNEQIHADLCRLIYDIAVSRNIDVEPCSPTPKENP